MRDRGGCRRFDRLIRIAALCFVFDKNGEGVLNPSDHLTCYKVKGPKLAKQDRPAVEVANQFGSLPLEVRKPFLLCVPSTKTVLP